MVYTNGDAQPSSKTAEEKVATWKMCIEELFRDHQEHCPEMNCGTGPIILELVVKNILEQSKNGNATDPDEISAEIM